LESLRGTMFDTDPANVAKLPVDSFRGRYTRLGVYRIVLACLNACSARDTFLLEVHDFRRKLLRFWVVAPLASEWAAFQKYYSPDSRTVMN